MTEATGLQVRKLADKTDGERVKRYDPETGVPFLADPETHEPKPWPFLGVQIEGEAPTRTLVSTSFLTRARSEGWIEVEGEQVVHRPGGPPEDPWRVTHTFQHYEAVVIKTVDGDVRYKVRWNPDKWPEEKLENDIGFGGDVFWTYVLDLEG